MNRAKIITILGMGLCSWGLFIGFAAAGEAEGYRQLLDKLKEKGVLTDTETQDILKTMTAPPLLPPQQEAKKPTVKVGGMVRVRYTATQNDSRIEEDPYLNGRFSDTNGFGLRWARLIISGEAAPYFLFTLSSEFNMINDYKRMDRDNVFGSNTFFMRDAFIYYTRSPYAQVKAGQFKVPFSREFLTSGSALITPNRSLPVNFLAPFRDMGIQVDGKFLDQAVQYAVGAFNGAGQNNGDNNDHLLYVGRLVLGTPKDFQLGGRPFKFSLGGGYAHNRIEKDYFFVDDRSFEGRERLWGMDAEVDFAGFNLIGEYLRADLDWRASTRRTSKDGYYIQGGYFILPETLQAVVKYEVYDADMEVSNNRDKQWTTFGLNYYWKGHDTKIAVNYILKDERGLHLDDNTFLAEWQVRF